MALWFPHTYKKEEPCGPGLPKWPFRAVISGPPASGKRSTVMGIVARMSRFPDRIICVHHDPEGSAKAEYSFAHEWVDVNNLPDWADMPVGGRAVSSETDSDDAESGEGDDDAETGDGAEKDLIRTLMIFDELAWSGMGKATLSQLERLFNFVSTHRNASLIVVHQNFAKIPIPIRDACRWIILQGQLVNRVSQGIVATRIGCEVEELRDLQTLLKTPYDCLAADIGKDPADRWKLNLWYPIRMRAHPEQQP